MPTKHAFTSPKTDGADATLVRPSNWNADHLIVGGGPWLAAVTSTVTVVNTVTETTLFTYTIIGGAPAVGDLYRMTAWGRYFNNTGATQTVTWRLKYGGTTLHTSPAIGYGTTAAQRSWLVRFHMLVTGASAQQSYAEMWGQATGWDGQGWAAMGTGESMVGYSSAAEATSINKAMALTAQHGAAVAGLTLDIRGGLIERIAA